MGAGIVASRVLFIIGQKDPPQKENGIFFQKLDRSFKKGSGSNELNTAIKLQIYIGIWDKNSDCGPSWLGF